MKEERIPKETAPSEGLQFTSNGDGTCYLSGIGTCTDRDIVIPSVHNGERVTAIGVSVFYGNQGLRSVVIPNGVTTIGDSAFRDSGLKTVVIPDSVTVIEKYAFNGCEKLTDVIIGKKVTRIGDSAFGHCVSLTSVLLPDSVTTMGKNVFYGCTALQNVIFGSGMKHIGYGAFDSCSALSSVTLGGDLEAINDRAFFNCVSLVEIRFGGTTEQWKSDQILFIERWNYSTGNYTVICTDGTVSKDGVVTPDPTEGGFVVTPGELPSSPGQGEYEE